MCMFHLTDCFVCNVYPQEEYVEYSRHGTVLKGQEKIPVKSVYEEDVYPQNHTVSNHNNMSCS